MRSATEQFDEHYMTLLEAARNHWWVQGMRDIGASLLGTSEDAPLDVLDAGCGTGALLPWAATLSSPSLPIAIDVSPVAVQRCRMTALPAVLAVGSVASLPFSNGSFDLVLSSDVLQHLTRELADEAVAEMARVLRPGGRLLIRTNSAHGRRDVTERDDWRLYRPAMLRAALESAGLQVERLTPVNFVQGVWASVPRPRLRRTAEHHADALDHTDPLVDQHREHRSLGIPEAAGSLKNWAMLRVLHAERWYLRHPGRSLPFGHSLYAVARRP